MHLTLIKKISVFMIPIFIILFMSYRHSIVVEGLVGSKSSNASNEQSQAYTNAATVDEYLKNQCTNDQLDELKNKLDNITEQMQEENEKMETSN